MSEAPKYTTLRDYLRVLREQRLVVVFIVLLFVGAAFLFSTRQAPVYEAKASLSFRGENEDLGDFGSAQPVTETAEQRAATSAQSIVNLMVAERASRELQPTIAPATILNAVEVQAEARTNFVVVQARARDAQRAADLANAYAEAARDEVTAEQRAGYAERAKTLRRENRDLARKPINQYTRASNVARIQLLESLARFAQPVVVAVEARKPSTPIAPKPIRNALLGLLSGLTVALIVAFTRDALDRRFKGIREIREQLHLPLLGHVRDEVLGRSISDNGRPALDDGELEAFRILRMNVDFLDVDHDHKTLAVTSALPEEGKSTVAGALAAAYATAGRRVLLVDCDLRRPTLASRLGLNAQPGLSDYLAGRTTPQEVLQTVAIAPPKSAGEETPARQYSLVCITAGTPTPRPAELLGSQKFKDFLEQVGEVYDTIILDTSPLLSVVDTLQLVPLVDRVIMCIRASRTTRDQARAATAALEHFPKRPIGIVVTGLRAGDEADYGYYSYAYAYGPTDA